MVNFWGSINQKARMKLLQILRNIDGISTYEAIFHFFYFKTVNGKILKQDGKRVF